MSIRITSGSGTLFEKEMPDLPLARISFNLMETDATRYTKKRWWGEFGAGEQLRHLGNFLIAFEDGRRGECVVIANTEPNSSTNKTWYYHFNGRGGLGRK